MKHWVDQYRNSPLGTLEWWIYLAATCCCGSEDRIRAVGEYAFKHDGCGIWHAAWELSNKQNLCYCAPCCNARDEKSKFVRWQDQIQPD